MYEMQKPPREGFRASTETDVTLVEVRKRKDFALYYVERRLYQVSLSDKFTFFCHISDSCFISLQLRS